MKTSLIDLTRQCCDADGYLSLGYRCATTNSCYDELRPVGDALWFSLPYRLGLSEQCLLYIQAALLLLLGYSLFILFRKTKAIVFTLLAMAAVMLQLWPTFFNTLADTPASLLLIEGLVLALIACQHQRAWLYFVAGIFLGCSALLRAAYFNPLCAAGLVFFIFWLWHYAVKKRKTLCNSIFILSFTLPMMLQFYVSWKNMHEWSFISRLQTQAQLSDHLNSAVVGYDTLLIESAYYWAPPCTPSKGVLTGIREHNFMGVYCLLSNRIYFYLGSYAPYTFYGKENKNLASNSFAEEVGNISAWTLHNMTGKQRAALSPSGNMKAGLLTPQKTAKDPESYIESASIVPLKPDAYHYSIWLWTYGGQSSTAVNMEFFSKSLSRQTQDWRYQLIHQEMVALTNQPKQFFFDIKLPETSYLATRINTEKELLAWGAMLENSTTSTGYIVSQQPLYSPIGSAPQQSGHERLFSKTLLVINAIVIIGSFIFLLQLCKKTYLTTYFFISTLLALIMIEALLILPEQRFLQASLSMHWILFLLFLSGYKK